MGGAVSDLQPAPYGFDYMCVMSYWCDSFRVIYGSTREMDIIRHAIQENWSKGIQAEKVRFGNTYEFKLNGYPFNTQSSLQNAIECRKVGCTILQRLHNAGWEVLASSDLTRTTDHLTWFLHRNHNIVPTSYPFICIGLSRTDSLHVINASTAIQEIVKKAITRVWPKGIQNLKYEGDTLVIKLCGYPWLGNGEEAVYSRLLIQCLINDLYHQQWVLHTNSNVKSDADSLFFCYDPSVINRQQAGIFSVSLNQTDRLRVIGATGDLVDAVRQVIQTYWTKGIQEERDYAGSWEFKLRGTPWWATGAEAVSSRYFILKVLEMFATRGWLISASIDSSRKPNDKSFLVFQRCNPMQAPMFCLSFNDVDKIRLINAPQDIIQVCSGIIRSHWVKGVKHEELYAGSHEFKLNGWPWCQTRHSHDGTHIRGLLCFILQSLASRNWRILTSADVSAKYVHQDNGPDYPLDVHSWYFIYDESLGASLPAMGVGSTPFGEPPPSYDSVLKTLNF